MHLLVGLGNPGSSYERNRHNIGFMVLDEIAQIYRAANWQSKFQGLLANISIDGQKCLLLKPNTFMNLSGDSVNAALRFYKLDPDKISVIHDELDLPCGKVKLKMGGGHGGHNGLRSISSHIGDQYRRIRIGIGHPGQKHLVSNYVLSDFSKQELEEMDRLSQDMAKALPHLLTGQNSKFIEALGMTNEKTPTKAPKQAKTTPKKSAVQAATQSKDDHETGLKAQLQSWLKGSPKGDN